MLPAISPQEAFERFSKGEARLVDIRETDEYTQEFVPGSRLIPLSIIAKHPLKDADAPDKPIVFFCHSGNRTANASDLLERLAGDVQAYRLDGGISGWEKAGLPVEHISSTIPLFRQIQIAAGSLVLIGVIMLLVPGIPFTNAIRDILLGDIISGSLRLVEAVLLAAMLALGMMAAIWLMGGAA